MKGGYYCNNVSKGKGHRGGISLKRSSVDQVCTKYEIDQANEGADRNVISAYRAATKVDRSTVVLKTISRSPWMTHVKFGCYPPCMFRENLL